MSSRSTAAFWWPGSIHAGLPRAGMRAGDIIVAVAGHPVKNLSELRGEIGRHKVGETVELAVRREKTSVTLKVTLAEMR